MVSMAARLAACSAPLLLLLLLLLVVAEVEAGPPKAKKVRCKDRNFPACYKQTFYCPDSCLRTCVADCARCQPVCLPTPSPPPPRRSPPPPPPPPDQSEAAGGKRVRCRNKAYPQCNMIEHTCPSTCPQTCEVDCVTCKPICDCDRVGAVCQDPRFIGGDGVTFYFHGKKDRDFCLVSDSNLHINGHFIGRRNQDMKRDFTWVQALGILFDTHQLHVGAKKTATWDDAVDRLALAVDGEQISLPEYKGATWQSPLAPGVTITRAQGTNSVNIEAKGKFRIKASVVPITKEDSLIHSYGVTQEDCFAHLDLSFKFYGLTGEVSGILGQTYAPNYVSRAKMGVSMPVLGGEREFASSGLFATDCAASRFIGQLGRLRNSTAGTFGHANLSCVSGEDSPGVVCRR